MTAGQHFDPYETAQVLYLLTPDASAEDIHGRIERAARDMAASSRQPIWYADPGVEKVRGWLEHFRAMAVGAP